MEELLPQIYFYVPDDVAEKIKVRAVQANLPISRHVADLVERDVGQGWSMDYFEGISDVAEGAAIRYEPSGPPEERLPLE